jgi:hypothetical protein
MRFQNISFDRIGPEAANWDAQVQSRLAPMLLFILLAFNKKWQRPHACHLERDPERSGAVFRKDHAQQRDEIMIRFDLTGS